MAADDLILRQTAKTILDWCQEHREESKKLLRSRKIGPTLVRSFGHEFNRFLIDISKLYSPSKSFYSSSPPFQFRRRYGKISGIVDFLRKNELHLVCTRRDMGRELQKFIVNRVSTELKRSIPRFRPRLRTFHGFGTIPVSLLDLTWVRDTDRILEAIHFLTCPSSLWEVQDLPAPVIHEIEQNYVDKLIKMYLRKGIDDMPTARVREIAMTLLEEEVKLGTSMLDFQLDLDENYMLDRVVEEVKKELGQ